MELQENIYDKELAEQIEKASVRVPVNTAIIMCFNLFLCCWMCTLLGVLGLHRSCLLILCWKKGRTGLGQGISVTHSSSLPYLVSEAS